LDEKVPTSIEIAACLKDCVLKLNKYFEGKKTEFEFTIHPKATTFPLKV
jgi:methylated-DNA-[protein]-cysteine S-methyltransferase